MGRTAISNKLRVFVAALAVGLVTVAPATSAPAIPVLTSPADGAQVTFLPAFKWNQVGGADHYEFQLAADPLFNSPLFSISGKNTSATPDKTVPNGTYWWRVRSVDSAGSVSPWAGPQSVDKLWAGAPALSSPADGATISYPAEPLVLRWNAVPGAAKYRVYVASDVTLGSLIGSGTPVETQALNYVPPTLLASNTYYWAVTPLDAQGNAGEQSEVRSFTWDWPSSTTPTYVDLVSDTELFDPQFSWDPVPGAARYEVEINSSVDFASGSKVCCTDEPISTTLTPLDVFGNATYYWRVRAIDANDNAGVWNEGPAFDKTFDNYPALDELAIKNLRMRDAADPGTDLDPAPGYQTDLPIITWDPVPGASSYQVDVVPFNTPSSPGACDWNASSFNRWTVPTASTAWSPLGWGILATPPFGSGISASKDQNDLVPGESYCARVRARSGRVSTTTPIWGDYTWLDDGTGVAFTFTDFPTGGACSPSCYAGYLGADDYALPLRGETVPGMPLFTWNPLAGKAGYWVIVAKDPTFSNIVDYAFTRIPAYAVRTGSQPKTYPDATTGNGYYWVVLPANGTNGSGSVGNPSLGEYASFKKRTAPPDLLAPADGAVFTGQPTFQWTPTFGARWYRVVVDDEPTFGSPTLDDVKTASTAFTALKTYPSAKTLYWRVQAGDENGTGLTWSATGTFQVALPAPVLDPGNATAGDGLPVVSWFSVPGAVSYDLQAQEPNSTTVKTFSGFPSTAASWVKMTGVGIFTWKVRAEFPKSGFGTQPGPWSAPATYTHTIGEPQNPSSETGQNRLVLSWDAKTGTKQYKVQISKRADFAPYIETKTTDNPTYASTLTSASYADGGSFYWRVAAIDADSNVGDWATRTFILPALAVPPPATFNLSSSGRLVKNRYRTVSIYVKNADTLAPVGNATVRASGAGVALTTKLTGSDGVAQFNLRPTKLGKVEFRVSKSGYATAYLYRRVRAP